MNDQDYVKSLQLELSQAQAELEKCREDLREYKSTIESLQDIANGAKQDGAEIIWLEQELSKMRLVWRSALIEHKDALAECLDVIHHEIAKDDERLDAFQQVLEGFIPQPEEDSK